MTKPLRQTLEIPYGDDAISVDVTFRVIEPVERIFGAVADIVVADELVFNPQRYKVADAISEILFQQGHDKNEAKENVISADAETFRKYVGFLQGAVLYTLKYVDEGELKKLANGEDIDADQKTKKKA